MDDGFFSLTQFADTRPAPLIPKCGLCQLDKQCLSPKMPLWGQGERGILIVAEAPGKDEDERNRPLVGKAGQYLRSVLVRLGIDLDRDCFVTNALICRPTLKVGATATTAEYRKNRSPTKNEILYCRPNVVKHIQDIAPHTIILLGGPAVESVVGWLWKEDVGKISRWTGWNVPCQKINAWLCPTNHPSYCMRQDESIKGGGKSVASLLFQQHLEQAFAHHSRPFSVVPDYKEQVQVVVTPKQAAHLIRELIRMNRPVAFDYETEALKPDSKTVDIVSCAASNGIVTVAYPWVGETIPATRELLLSDLPKLAHNMQFEQRWAQRKLGIQVRNWALCTMLGSHILDNRKGTASLKFQAFVRLGQPQYDEHMKPYFNGQGGNGKNRSREVDLRTLLLYNGLDALLTFELAKIQANLLGLEIF